MPPALASVGIAVDIIAVLALIYIVFVLSRTKKYDKKKTSLTLNFERTKREDIFKKSLAILALSLIFSFTAAYAAAFGIVEDNAIELIDLLSKVFLFIFVLIIIQITKYGQKV